MFSGLHIQNLGPGKCSRKLAPFEINLIFLQIWFSKCLFKLYFLSWNCYLWNSPHTIRSKLKNFKFSRRLTPLWNTLRLWWSPWQQFFTKDNIRNLFTECIYIKYKKLYGVISSFFGYKTKRVRMYKNSVQNIKKVISSKGLSLWVSVSIWWGKGLVETLLQNRGSSNLARNRFLETLFMTFLTKQMLC